jgi:hypothetical protein
MLGLGFDLADEFGVKASESHYVAVALKDYIIVAYATGIGQESAIHNLYSTLAKYDARKDIEKYVYEM